jgi:vanillate O-demethylase monooxygenase subunit
MVRFIGWKLITCIQRVPEVAVMSTFPLNAWYACAYDVEIKLELFAHTVCNQTLVMYSRLDSTVAILEDACWHRLLPPLKGRLNGDEGTCGYHSLVYNADARRTHMPSQETINPSACMRSYPLAERHSLVWVCTGDLSLADVALIPDLHRSDGQAFARNYSLREQRLTHELREGVASTLREDGLILEAQQQAIDEHPGYSFYNLNIDAGSIWMRRLIDKMIAAETGAPVASRVIPLRSVA